MLKPRPSIARSLSCSISRQRPTTLPVAYRSIRTQLKSRAPQQYRSLFHVSKPLCVSSQSDASSAKKDLNRTSLYDLHVKYGGTMVDFGGYEMPLEYKGMGISETALWTRSKASIFDVGHMTQHKFVGDGVAAFLETVTPSLISTLEPFQSTYSAFLNDQAGIVDDTIITNITESAPTYHVVTNAANYDRVKEYFETELANYGDKSNVAWEIVQNTGMIALQGPLATTILQSLKPMHTGQPFDLSTLTFGNARWLTFRDANETVTPAILVSRTGYTGEDGFELSIPHPDPAADNTTQRVTEYLLAATAAEAGGSSSDKPVRLAGLAARDILRIEAGLCLHGSDIDEATTPVQGSIAFIIPKARRTADAGWKGAATMYGPEAKKAGRKRVGLVMDQQVVARHGMRVLAAGGGDGGGAELGTVTSGGPSPTLGKPIAMASVASSVKVGDEVDVEIRKKLRKAKVVKMPFVPTKYYKGPEKS